jgi:hypothetical protein
MSKPSTPPPSTPPPSTPPSLVSWGISKWPDDVYPNSSSKAKYLVRCHRDELMRAGVLSRVGRELIVLGARYSKWLQKRGANVAGYEIAANRARSIERPAA